MELYQFKHLLEQVGSLNARYKKIAELTGEKFNTFRILKLESSEVRLHSAFLAELLNPSGSHGQKDAFLKLFLKRFCFKNNPLDIDTCKVHIEKHTAFISQDGTEGGRIDIMLIDKNHCKVIIENKIYAGDQTNQLMRYHNYDTAADLIYLTLYGKEPSDDSKGKLESGLHYKCYSYKTDIVDWLEECRKEVAVYPIIRESLTQYINLIKYLTNQTVNHMMAEELHTLIKANLESSFMISDSLDNSLDEILKVFIIEVKDMCSSLDLECGCNVDLEKNHTGFFIYKKEWSQLNIGFQFQDYDSELRYGIVAKTQPNKVDEKLRNSIFKLGNNTLKPNLWWPWSNIIEPPYNDWGKYKAWKAIQDGAMLDAMKEKITMLLALTKGIDL